MVSRYFSHIQFFKSKPEHRLQRFCTVAPVPVAAPQHINKAAAVLLLIEAQQLNQSDETVLILFRDAPAVVGTLIVFIQFPLQAFQAFPDILVGRKEHKPGHIGIAEQPFIIFVNILHPKLPQQKPVGLKRMKIRITHGGSSRQIASSCRRSHSFLSIPQA